MKILLDENLPERLLRPLRLLGHEVDSVTSLRLKGLDNGRLFREVASQYDLCFTKDMEFVRSVRRYPPTAVKLIRVNLQQTRSTLWAESFMTAFMATDWSRHGSGAEWPFK